MADPAQVHCKRCAQMVDAVRPWPGYRWIKRGWFAGLLVLLCLMPIILSEITVLLPLAMIFAVAGGPVLSLSSQPVTCRQCGAELGACTPAPEAR